jgi:hypothetical protein
LLHIDNIGEEFRDEYLENYDGIGAFYIPEIPLGELEL